MTSIGELGLSVEMDLSDVEQQIQELEQYRVKPIEVKFAVDRNDLQQQLKSLKIDPIKVGLELDTSRYKEQLKALSDNQDFSITIDTQKSEQAIARLSQQVTALKADLERLSSEEIVIKTRVEGATNRRQIAQQVQQQNSVVEQVTVTPTVDNRQARLDLDKLAETNVDVAVNPRINAKAQTELNNQVSVSPQIKLNPNSLETQLSRLKPGEVRTNVQFSVEKFPKIKVQLDTQDARRELELSRYPKLTQRTVKSPIPGVDPYIEISRNPKFKLNVDSVEIRSAIDRGIATLKDAILGTAGSSSSGKSSSNVIRINQVGGGIFNGFVEGLGSSIADRSFTAVSDAIGAAFAKITPDFRQVFAEGAKLIGKGVEGVVAPYQNILGGFQQGIGFQISDKFTTGFLKNVESELGVSVERIGEVAGDRFVNQASKVSQFVGASNGKEDFKEMVRDAYGLYQDVGGAEDPIAASQERYRAGYKRSAEIVKERAASEEVAAGLSDDVERLVFTFGGYGGEKGLASNRIAGIAENILPKHAAIPILNKETEIRDSVFANPLGFFPQALGSALRPVARGYNRDAINAASKAYAYHQKFPDKPIDLLGYSGGGFVATETAEILKELGVQSKAISLGTPFFGNNVQLPKDQHLSLFGELDPLRASTAINSGGFANQNNLSLTTGGATHLLPEYALDADVHKQIQTFFGQQATPVPQQNLEEIEKLIPELPDDYVSPRFLSKQQVQARQFASDKSTFQDATANTQQQIEALGKDQDRLYEEIRIANAGVEDNRNLLEQQQQALLAKNNKRARNTAKVAVNRQRFEERKRQEEAEKLQAEQERIGVSLPKEGLLPAGVEPTKENFQSQIKTNKAQIKNAFQQAKSATGAEKLTRLKTLYQTIEQEEAKIEAELEKQVGKEVGSVLGNYKSYIAGKGESRPGLKSQVREQYMKLSNLMQKFKPVDAVNQELLDKAGDGQPAIDTTFVKGFNAAPKKKQGGSQNLLGLGLPALLMADPTFIPSVASGIGSIGTGVQSGLGGLAAGLGGLKAGALSGLGGLNLGAIAPLLASPLGLAGAGAVGIGAGIAGARAARPVLEPIAPVLYKDVGEVGKQVAAQLGSTLSSASKTVSNSVLSIFQQTKGGIEALINAADERLSQFQRKAQTQTKAASSAPTTQATTDSQKFNRTVGARAKDVTDRPKPEPEFKSRPPETVNVGKRNFFTPNQFVQDRIDQGERFFTPTGRNKKNFLDRAEQTVVESAQDYSTGFGLGRKFGGIYEKIGSASPALADRFKQGVSGVAAIASPFKGAIADIQKLKEGVSGGDIIQNFSQRFTSGFQRINDSFKTGNFAQKYFKDILFQLEVTKSAFNAGFNVDKLANPLKNIANGILPGLGDQLGTVFKGFIAFKGLEIVKNILTGFGKEAIAASIKLDNLKTSLNFSSGGEAQGANNLKFVYDEVDRLRIPLGASIEGFTKLNAATRNTAVEGQATKDVFTGIGEAATVLGLTSDQVNGAILALSQVSSKGKLSSEELRQQLGERLPGAVGIASRALGVTEAQLNKMLETGQVLAQDFLPKFGKQLHLEFGEAAKSASGNAQSAIFNFQNAFLKLQQNFGQGLSPAVVTVLNALGSVLNVVAVAGEHLGSILALVTAALVQGLLGGLTAPIAVASLLDLALLGLTTAFGAVVKALKAFSAELVSAGLTFVLVELIKGIADAINTDLVKAFDRAADSATRAAKASAGIQAPGQEEDKGFLGTGLFKRKKKKAQAAEDEDLPEINFVDSFSRNYAKANVIEKSAANVFTGFAPLVGEGLNRGVNFLKTGSADFYSYGDLQRDRLQELTGKQVSGNARLLAEGQNRLTDFKQGRGDFGKFKTVTNDLTQAESDRRGLQGRIERDYTRKGLAVPPELKAQLEASNVKISGLVGQRAEAVKPLQDDLNRTNQQISATKGSITALSQPETVNAIGGEQVAAQKKKELEDSLKALTAFKDKTEAALATTKADPIIALSDAFNQLGAEINGAQREVQKFLATQKEQITRTQVDTFSTDRNASRVAARDQLETEREGTQREISNTEKALATGEKALSDGGAVNLLNEMGLNKDSSLEAIDKEIKVLGSDEKNKPKVGILEQFKTYKELEEKLLTQKSSLADQDLRLKQQDESDFLQKDEILSKENTSKTQRKTDTDLSAIKKKVSNRGISAEQGEIDTAKAQKNNIDEQITELNRQLTAYKQANEDGDLSAENYKQKELEIGDRLSGLQAQKDDQELARVDAVRRKRVSDLELANRKAEAVISLDQTKGGAATKQKVLTGDLTTEGAAIADTNTQQTATAERIKLIKKELDQTKQLRKEGTIDARTATEKELQLNQQLADANSQLIDGQIQKQSQLRTEIERTFQRKQEELKLETTRKETAIARDELNTLKSGPVDRQALELKTQGRGLVSRAASISEEISLVQQELAALEALDQADQESKDKKLATTQKLAGLQKEQISVEKDLVKNAREQAIQLIERETEAAKAGFDIKIAGIEKEKVGRELINASLDRSKQLMESQVELQKALSDASIAQSQIQLDATSSQLSALEKLGESGNAPFPVRNALEQQAGVAGVGRGKEIINQLTAGDVDPETKKKLERELNGLNLSVNSGDIREAQKLNNKLAEPGLNQGERGRLEGKLQPLLAKINAPELALLDRKQQLEDEIAKKKMAALEAEQKATLQLRRLDLDRAKINAQNAFNEAQIAYLRAQQGTIEAQGKVDTAVAEGDSVKIAAARKGLGLAEQVEGLSLQQVGNADSNVKIQDELAKNALETLEINQKTALAQAKGADALRDQNQQLERATTLSKGLKDSKGAGGSGGSGSGESISGRPTVFGGLGGKMTLGASARAGTAQDMQIRQADRIMAQQGQAGFDLMLKNLAKTGEIGRNQYLTQRLQAIGKTDVLAEVAKAAQPRRLGDRASSLGDSLRDANREVVNRLDRLISVSSGPRIQNLNVSAPKPVQSAGKIASDLSAGAVSSAGLG